MSNTASRAWLKVSGGLVGLLVLLAVLIAANVILSNARIRVDLTEEGLYTLSKGTRNILGGLDRRVTLKLFFNGNQNEIPPFIKAHGKLVEDLLIEYKLAGKGKIAVEKYNPTPDSDDEDWAGRYGIPGRQLGMLGPKLYFGLVVVAGETEASIPFLSPEGEQLLEYNITRMIYRVVHPQKPVVGVMSSLPVLGERMPPYMMQGAKPPQAWLTFRLLKEDYVLREVPATAEEIEKDINALVLVHPKELSDETMYAIDQFVLRGGRLLAFLDPMCVADKETSSAQPYMPAKNSSDLNKLLSAWGIGYSPDIVVADLAAATPVAGPDNNVVESPVWLTLDRRSVSSKDVLTAQLEAIMIPFGGYFTDETSADLTVTPLAFSSKSAGTLDSMSAWFGAANLGREFKKAPGPLNVAVRVAGNFKTAFPEGKPKKAADDKDKDGKKKENEAADKKEDASLKEGRSTVVLVGDVDMIYDRFCVREIDILGFKDVRPFNDNLNFFVNAVEQMSSGAELASIRSRGKFDRPFDRVRDLEEQARGRWQEMEKQLTTRLEETQRKLRELEGQKDKQQRLVLSKEQQQAITQFRREEMEIKENLKQVQKNLRRDIERLGVKVKVANIVLMPVIVALTGLCFYLYRRSRK